MTKDDLDADVRACSVRLECLHLAQELALHAAQEFDVLEVAQAYCNFVTGLMKIPQRPADV